MRHECGSPRYRAELDPVGASPTAVQLLLTAQIQQNLLRPYRHARAAYGTSLPSLLVSASARRCTASSQP